MNNKIFIFHATDYQNYPLGGTVGTIKTYLKYTNFQCVLIGITNDPNIKVGKWQVLSIHGKQFDFLPVAYSKRELIPHKVLMPLGLIIFAKKIMEKCDQDILNAMIFINRECYPIIKYILGRKKKVNVFYRMTEAVNPLITSGRPITKFKIIQDIYYHFFIKRLILGSSLIFSINEDCRNFCERILLSDDQRKKIIDISHYVDFDYLYDLFKRTVPVPKSAQTKLVYWGRLAKVKGLELMIESVNHLIKKGMSVELLIIGDGPERERLLKKVEELGIKTQVEFLGRRNIQEIAALCKNADLFLMSSLSEGVPTALLEALTFGLPVVATSVGAIPALVKNGINGYLVEKRDVNVYSSAIYKALRLNKEKAARYSQDIVKKKFSARSVVYQMDSLMRKVIEGNA